MSIIKQILGSIVSNTLFCISAQYMFSIYAYKYIYFFRNPCELETTPNEREAMLSRATECYLCKKPFTNSCIKCLDHNHL